MIEVLNKIIVPTHLKLKAQWKEGLRQSASGSPHTQ